MKICIQCKKENPSSANHCMHCGTALVEEDLLSDETKLLKKIKELEKENELKTKLLEKELEKNGKAEQQTQAVAVQPTVAPPLILPPPPSNKKWIIFAILAILVLLVGIVVFLNSSDKPDNAKHNNEKVSSPSFPDREKLKNIIERYYQGVGSGDYYGLVDLFAPNVEQFFAKKNVTREDALKPTIEYNKQFYNQHFDIDWNSLKVYNQRADYVSVSYILIYDFQWYEPYRKNGDAKPNYFEENIFVKINADYRITNIQENVLYKKVK